MSACWPLPFLGLALVLACGCGASRPQSSARKKIPIPPLAKAVIRTAKAYLPEEENPRAAPKDCSDFVVKVFAEHEMALPRTAAQMSLLGARVASSRDLRMADLVFFSGSKIDRIVGHVGIYINNGIFIHFSNETAGVTAESLYSDYYRRRYLTARRVIP